MKKGYENLQPIFEERHGDLFVRVAGQSQEADQHVGWSSTPWINVGRLVKYSRMGKHEASEHIDKCDLICHKCGSAMYYGMEIADPDHGRIDCECGEEFHILDWEVIDELGRLVDSLVILKAVLRK